MGGHVCCVLIGTSLPHPSNIFPPFLSGEVDTRFSFCALASLTLLGQLGAVDVPKAVQFVLSCMNFDGGFGSMPGSESHAGQVRCCESILSQPLFPLHRHTHTLSLSLSLSPGLLLCGCSGYCWLIVPCGCRQTRMVVM